MESFPKNTPEGQPDISNEEEEKSSRKKSSRAKNIARAAALSGLGLLSVTQESSAQDHSDKEGDRGMSVESIAQAPVREEGVDATALLAENMEEMKRKELLEKVSAFDLVVSKDGDLKRLRFDLNNLSKWDRIQINGFVVDIQVEATSKLDIDVNGKQFERYHHVHPDDSPEEEFLYETGRFRSMNLPFSDTKEISVSLSDSPDYSFEVEIDQQIFEDVREIHTPFSFDESLEQSIDTTHVRYLGSDSKTLEAIPDLKDKLDSIAQGVVFDVENTFDINLVDTLGVIESDEENAFILEDENVQTLFFFQELIEKRSKEELRLIARHEALHHFTIKTGYTSLLEDLFYETPPRIARFMNESHFFNAFGGHAEEDEHEFTTSLMNSLLDIEKIDDALKRDVSFIKGEDEQSFHAMDDEYREEILSTYIEAVSMMLSSAEELVNEGVEAYQHDVDFFTEKLSYLKSLSN